MSTYPATTYADGVELTITSGNQLHEIINGTATEEITTESGMVPSVRKAIADSMLFKQAIEWAQGSVETDPLQTRNFNGTLFWAPAATTANPIAMGASPVSDSNWSLAPVGRDTVAMNANLISNSHFEFTGTVTNPPDAVARNYDDGDEIFSGIYAKGAITNVTFVDGVLNGFGELYVDVVKNAKMKEATSGVISSIAGTNGEPYITGSSVTDAGDYYRVTFIMNNTFSVKLEQGSVATGHEVESLSVKSLSDYTDIVYKASGGKTGVENLALGIPKLADEGDLIEISDRGSARFKVVSGGTPDGYGILDAGGGNTAVMQHNGELKCEWFGATTTMTLTEDRSPNIQAAVNYDTENVRKLTCTSKIYLASQINWRSGLAGRFDGRIIIDENSSPNGIIFNVVTTRFTGDGLYLDVSSRHLDGADLHKKAGDISKTPNCRVVYTRDCRRFKLKGSIIGVKTKPVETGDTGYEYDFTDLHLWGPNITDIVNFDEPDTLQSERYTIGIYAPLFDSTLKK